MEHHEHWMQQALEVGAENPRAPFGTIIVHVPTQRILAGGCNHTLDSPIWHGEMDALSQLDREAPFAECALYTTGEPCSMCASAIVWAQVGTVVYGSSIPYLESIGWNQLPMRAAEIIGATRVVGGVLEEACNRTFLQAVELRRSEIELPRVLGQDVAGRLLGLPRV